MFKGYADTTAAPTYTCNGTPSASPGNTFVGSASGNIDTDTTLDLWTISTDGRVGSATCDSNPTGNIASGEPANDVNDVNR